MNDNCYFQPITDEYFLSHAIGNVRFGMTNDYMFRAVLQESKKGLNGLIGALLYTDPKQIDIEIKNPIIIGRSITEKEFRFDLHIAVNNKSFINLEMQNLSQYWENRSLLYLCRAFDTIQRGQDYNAVSSIMHIGLLNFTLFKDEPEFYASYKLMNEKTHKVYNDRFTLRCLDLTKIKLATDKDKEYNVDKWAIFFKAKTWREIKMIAAQDSYINDTAKNLFLSNEDEQIRKLALDAEEHQNFINSLQNKIDRQASEIDRQASEIDRQASEIHEKENTIADQNAEIEKLKKALNDNGINIG